MTTYNDIMANVAKAYSFLRSDDKFRRDLLAESGAINLIAGPNREGDCEVKLTFIDGKTLTLIVLLREITEASTEGVPVKMRALFFKRLREYLPVVKG